MGGQRELDVKAHFDAFGGKVMRRAHASVPPRQGSEPEKCLISPARVTLRATASQALRESASMGKYGVLRTPSGDL